MTQISRRFALLAIAFTVIAGGCAKTSRTEATGKGTIRGINGIVTAPELNFLIEERNIGSVGFREAAGFAEYDDLTYNFNFDIILPGATSASRIATQFVDVVADMQYTLVLTGTLANPSILLWEDAERDWDGTEAVFESDFLHLSPQLGQVDVYYATAGTAPVLGNEIGTLAFGERLPYQEFTDGQYVLILTAPDDPATVIYQSRGLTPALANRVTHAIFDADPSITATVGVSLIGDSGGAANLADANIPSQIKLLHAAFGTGNVDGFFDGDLVNAVFQNVGFGDLTAYTDIPGSAATITLTPFGESDTTLVENDILVTNNSKSTVFFGGAPGELLIRVVQDDARPLSSFPVVRITNMSVNTDSADVYILDPGTAIDEDTLPRFAFLPSFLDTGFFAAESGMRELTLTLSGEKTAISAPLVIDIGPGDIVDIVIRDTADPATLEMIVFDSN